MSKLHSVDNGTFRKQLLLCNQCFPQGRACRHHEDVIAGWYQDRPRQGRIVVVALNPQSTESDPVYQTIEAPQAWQNRVWISDNILDVYAHRLSVPAKLGWSRQDHRGMKTWFPLVENRLGVSSADLADHFSFVDLIKHATANEGELAQLCRRLPLAQNCPAWLLEQLRRLEPRLLIIAGRRGRDTVIPLLAPKTRIPGAMWQSHATRFECRLAGKLVRAYLSIAFARSANGWWAKAMQHPAVAARHDELKRDIIKAMRE